MRVSEIEISKIPNKLSTTIKKALKDKRGKKKKPSLKEVVNNVSLVFAIYKAIHVDKHFGNLTIIGFKNMSSL